MFSCEICKFLKNTYFEDHLRTAVSTFINYRCDIWKLYAVKCREMFRQHEEIIENHLLFHWLSATPNQVFKDENNYEMFCAICYHLYNLKNMRKTPMGSVTFSTKASKHHI